MNIFDKWIVNTAITKYGYITDTEPEHSKGSYQNAIKQNLPIFLCVQSLDDGSLICFAHKNISGVTNGSGYVQTLSLDEVKKLKIKNTNYTILSFEETLKAIGGKTPILINIFNNGVVGKMEPQIFKLLSEYTGEYAICSTNPFVVEWFKNFAPDVLRGIKSCKFNDKFYAGIKAKKLTKLKFVKLCEPDFIVYDACDLPNKFVKKYNYLPIIAANVINEQKYLEVVKHCDNIICDSFIPTI